jgi:hypothetical protein
MSRCRCLFLSLSRRLRQHGTWYSTINRHLAVGGERNTQREVHLSRIPNQQRNRPHFVDDPSSSLMPFSCRYGWWVCKRSSQGQSAIVTGAAGYKFDFQVSPTVWRNLFGFDVIDVGPIFLTKKLRLSRAIDLFKRKTSNFKQIIAKFSYCSIWDSNDLSILNDAANKNDPDRATLPLGNKIFQANSYSLNNERPSLRCFLRWLRLSFHFYLCKKES